MERTLEKRSLGGLLLPIPMLLLIVGGIAYAYIRSDILDERYGKPNVLAHVNLYEYFMVAVVFLVAPFIGGCSAFRLTRLVARPARFIGWLLVVMFSLFFLQAVLVCWSDYQRYAH
jgi:hypothetical protein